MLDLVCSYAWFTQIVRRRRSYQLLSGADSTFKKNNLNFQKYFRWLNYCKRRDKIMDLEYIPSPAKIDIRFKMTL